MLFLLNNVLYFVGITSKYMLMQYVFEFSHFDICD